MKNTKFISYSQQTNASMIVKLSLQLKWYYPIMPVNVLPQNEGFFPHDFTLIASVVGESVIGHGISGINFPDKMARIAKMQNHWSKQQQTLCITRSQGQSNQ
jgi:hypothetical protein